MQTCGVIGGGRIDVEPDNVFRVSSRINSTWGGNLVDMVRAQRYLEIIEEERLVENAASLGARLVTRLQALSEEFPGLITNPRGRGLMCAIDFPDAQLRDQAADKAYELGMIILPCGRRSLRFRPPLDITSAEVDEAADIIGQVARALAVRPRDWSPDRANPGVAQNPLVARHGRKALHHRGGRDQAVRRVLGTPRARLPAPRSRRWPLTEAPVRSRIRRTPLSIVPGADPAGGQQHRQLPHRDRGHGQPPGRAGATDGRLRVFGQPVGLGGQPHQSGGVEQDHHTLQSAAGVTGSSMSPRISTTPARQPNTSRTASSGGTSLATGRPRLVMTTG
jgi:hypothetical protein